MRPPQGPHDDADDEQREDEDEHGELKAEARLAVAPCREGGSPGAVPVAEEVLLVVGNPSELQSIVSNASLRKMVSGKDTGSLLSVQKI